MRSASAMLWGAGATYQHGKDPHKGLAPGVGGIGPVPQPNHAGTDAEDAEEPLLHDRAVHYVQLSGPGLCTCTATVATVTATVCEVVYDHSNMVVVMPWIIVSCACVAGVMNC